MMYKYNRYEEDVDVCRPEVQLKLKADGRIRIDNVEYNTLTLSSIPERFMTEANKIRQPPLNTRRLSLLQKCTTNSGKAIMVGHSLQKTPLGLAFYSKNCFLSNFYRCSFYFKGESYTCSEQAYQSVKAKIYRDEQAFTDIKKNRLAGPNEKYRGSSPNL